ncbi:MAG TPA: winged helix-turn-helix transcriptional regulator [Candidatus Baltobacteraceae bacterium]
MRRTLPGSKPYVKCPVEKALDIVGGRWKAILLFHVYTNPTLRFGELRRRIPGATAASSAKSTRKSPRTSNTPRRRSAARYNPSSTPSVPGASHTAIV